MITIEIKRKINIETLELNLKWFYTKIDAY